MIINYSIKKPVNEVYACLADVHKFVAHHPVLYKAEKTGDAEYVFYERIKFLFIPFRINYKVTLNDLQQNESVKMYSEVQKGVHLNLNFFLTPTPTGTDIKEEILIKASLFVKPVFQFVIKRAHKKLFKNIGNSISE
jgi:carbon monoxide dehydrogenase subunit G